jgi:mRNA interferase RelE/StbE
MSYDIYLKKSAERELQNLPQTLHDRVIKRLEKLQENPRPNDVKKIHGREGFRVRVGDYRLLYTIDDSKKTVEVVSVAHRRDVYRF